jgi:hypothetical protein
MLLWITGLLDEKVAIAVSGWSGETVAFDVHRSLCGDISMALPAVGTSERSWEGRPCLFDPWLATGVIEEAPGAALHVCVFR